MLCPVIQKVVFSKEVFVERRLPEPGGGKFFVKEGSKVRPFDFVAEIKDTVRQRLTAGVGGEVVRLLPGKAVLIKTAAVIVRGVVGRGEDDEGEIRIVAAHDCPIELSAVDASRAGNVLVGGYIPSLEVFKKAEAVGVKGIVCGGADFAAFQKTNLPTLLIEGFGRPPLNRRAFEFLKKVEGRHAFLSPDHEELLVARLDDVIEEVPEVGEFFVELKEGMEVQNFDTSRFGQMGKVVNVLKDTVEVLFEDGEKVKVPGRNVGIVK